MDRIEPVSEREDGKGAATVVAEAAAQGFDLQGLCDAVGVPVEVFMTLHDGIVAKYGTPATVEEHRVSMADLARGLHAAQIGCKPNVPYCRASHMGHARRLYAGAPVAGPNPDRRRMTWTGSRTEPC